jgi:hypothetical protein
MIIFRKRIRREYQAKVLSFSPTLLEDCSSWEQTWSDTPCDSSCASYLSDFDLELRLSIEPVGIIPLQEGGSVRWATASQRGYYPFEPDKPNQDANKSQVGIVNGSNLHWFSVFDGHGPDGHSLRVGRKSSLNLSSRLRLHPLLRLRLPTRLPTKLKLPSRRNLSLTVQT